MRLVNVGIPRSPLGPLTYSVPDDFPEIKPGMRVLVPLGPRFVTAFVIQTDVPALEAEMRPIADLLEGGSLFSPTLLKLTSWMSDYYLADWADLLKSALPPALDVRPETMISIKEEGMLNADHHPILQILAAKRQLPLKEIYKHFGHKGVFSEIRKLEESGDLEIIAERRRKRAAYNFVEIVAGADPPEKPKERELFQVLLFRSGPVPVEELRAKFKRLPAVIRSLKESGRIRTLQIPPGSTTIWPVSEKVEQLNKAQQKAYDRIRQSLGSFKVFLLHGVTGSGKTEVYLRMARAVLGAGKSVLFLVPEIALLPLLVHRAEKTLAVPISILHSELGERERLEEWQNARTGKVQVVVGTRSALFAPLKNLGLIVIDEEHDGSYKQNEYPRYHARESAIMRASFEKCPVILGSATPSIESFYNAGNGKYIYLSLPTRVEERPMPQFHLIDMKEEYRETGDPVFSRLLLEQIRTRLTRKEQTLILQNRRGYASLLMCRECGNVLECPNCSVTLTYHKMARRMRCHYCDYSRLAPSKCEKCGSRFLHLFGVGTEKITEAIRALFPEARIERFDRDATKKRGSIAEILTRFAYGKIDILVGTQMLAKGHDFPNITLVGVVGADSSIGIPDFRASEKLFQLITQVSGRSGRGMQPGIVIVQTFHPEHYAIRSAIEQDYRNFYEKEIRFRRLMQYPPYISLANVVFSGKQPRSTLEDARGFAKLVLVYKTDSMKLLGPAVAPLARLSGLYRFQLLLKSASRKDLHDCLRVARDRFQGSKHHSQFAIDVDPYSIV